MVWLKAPDRLGKSIRKQFIAPWRHRKQKHRKQEQQHIGQPCPGIRRRLIRQSFKRKDSRLGSVTGSQQIFSRKDYPFHQKREDKRTQYRNSHQRDCRKTDSNCRTTGIAFRQSAGSHPAKLQKTGFRDSAKRNCKQGKLKFAKL